CSRRLILSDDQQNNLELIRFLRGRTQLPMRLEEEDAKKLDLLFKYGAIHLSRANARKIVENFSESQVPTITAFSNITSGEAKTIPGCNIFEKGVTQQDISTTTPTPQIKQKTQKPTPKPQKTENKEAEAEDEMDKIFAEAQKNIEMER
ncbi:MAG: hypothetical protein IJA69_01575, partial [Clostridia bacterium]|nr:hypothetical protein [Clostridia bacterium]